VIRGIYIIGLPGSHKYKIGEYLKNWFDWEIIDLQEEVEKSLHKTLLEIINQKQLKDFENEQEKFIFSHIKSGIVFISSDVVPKPEIISKLKENGIIPIYLNYSRETLEKEMERNTILKVHPFEEYEKEIKDISNLLINVPTEGFTDKEIAVMIVRALRSEYDLIFSNNDKVYEGINAFITLMKYLNMKVFQKLFL
jgi:Shikimate kinase